MALPFDCISVALFFIRRPLKVLLMDKEKKCHCKACNMLLLLNVGKHGEFTVRHQMVVFEKPKVNSLTSSEFFPAQISLRVPGIQSFLEKSRNFHDVLQQIHSK